MSSWLLKSSNLLKPLYDKLHQHLLQQNAIQADETTLKVIEYDKAKYYMLLYCTDTDLPANNYSGTPNIVRYDSYESRASHCAIDFLRGHSDHLQIDDYQGYDSTQASLADCWTHARQNSKRRKLCKKKANPKLAKRRGR